MVIDLEGHSLSSVEQSVTTERQTTKVQDINQAFAEFTDQVRQMLVELEFNGVHIHEKLQKMTNEHKEKIAGFVDRFYNLKDGANYDNSLKLFDEEGEKSKMIASINKVLESI
jgi:hypothetical protein